MLTFYSFENKKGLHISLFVYYNLTYSFCFGKGKKKEIHE